MNFHASITLKAAGSTGDVTHIKSAQSLSAKSATGSAHISPNFIVG
jgi:hypothetical protein